MIHSFLFCSSKTRFLNHRCHGNIPVVIVYMFPSKDKNLTWTAANVYNNNIDQFSTFSS